MIARIKRLLRGDWPNRNETWCEYMDRDLNGAAWAACALVGGAVLVLLAEAIDRGIV